MATKRRVLTSPVHAMALRPEPTTWGWKHRCPEPGCDVLCWGGWSTTPADGRTRRLRQKCHERFDNLWRGGPLTREQAYEWLAVAMGVPQDRAHIGMLSADECIGLLAMLEGRGC